VHDDLAVEFYLILNNRSFVEYINLILAIPQQWTLNSVFVATKAVFEKLWLNGKTSKSSYCFLFSKLISAQTKQQMR